jgi:hypothetical protein
LGGELFDPFELFELLVLWEWKGVGFVGFIAFLYLYDSFSSLLLISFFLSSFLHHRSFLFTGIY